MDTSQPIIMGAAWYRENQWERLKEVSEDRDNLEETWIEWNQAVEKSLQEARSMGLHVEKVDVDIEELIQWCRAKRRPVNAESRASFAGEKTMKRHTA